MNPNPQYTDADFKDHLGIWLWLEDESGNILMLYHNKFDCWTIPLEKSEPGENLEAAIIRTGEEELGIRIKRYEVVHFQENTYERRGVKVCVVGYLVKILNYEGVAINKEPEKHSSMEWKTKRFIQNLAETTDAVKALKKHLI